MTRQQIIKDLKQYFKASELVCSHIYARWGESSWQFLDTDYLSALLVIRRDILKSAMICNNASMTQRGMRCNRCDMVKSKATPYISAHILGKGGDFTVKGMTADQARQKIKANAHLLPCPIRIENGVNWVHFDVRPQDNFGGKVYEFKA